MSGNGESEVDELVQGGFSSCSKEAHRTLKLDGRLHIYEATNGFDDRDQFAADLGRLGFGQVTLELDSDNTDS